MQAVQLLKKEALDAVVGSLMHIQEIPLTALRSNPFQKRKQYGDIRTLAESISSRGLQNPISIIKVDQGYVIVSGHRRVQAFKYLRRKSIPAIVRRESSGKDLAIDIAIENLQREDLTPVELGETLLQMIYTIPTVQNNPSRALTLINQIRLYDRREGVGSDFTGKLGFREEDIFIAKKVLKLVGISPNTATQYIRILQLPDEIQEKIVLTNKGQTNSIPEGKLSVKMAYELTRLKDHELQKDLCEKVLTEKMKCVDARFMVDEIIETSPGLANRNIGKGTAARRTDDNAGAAELAENLFRMSATVWNFRKKLPLICRRLDKILWVASLNKMKKVCLEMVANINLILKDDLSFEDCLELVNADLELQITSGKEKGSLRFSFPRSKAEILKLQAGDKLHLKIESVTRAAPNAPIYYPVADEEG